MREGNNNIPGGSLGPGVLLWVESCHGVQLKGPNGLSLDTSHLGNMVLEEIKKAILSGVSLSCIVAENLLESAAEAKCCW